MSVEGNQSEAQELELWDRIRTTEGAERAEVLDELSHFAYRKDNYSECIQLIDTSLEIYASLHSDLYTKQLIHLYEGKAHCHLNLNQHLEAAESFDLLAGYCRIDEDQEAFLKAKRAAGREWYAAERYDSSLECHTFVSQEIDINATDYSMGIDNLNIGLALQNLDRHQEAIAHLLKARALFKNVKNPEAVNWCDRYLSDSYLELQNGLEAVFHAQHSFNFAKASEDLDLEAYACGSLGEAHRLMKNYLEAERYLVRALHLLTEAEDRDWTNIIEVNQELAAVLFAQGKDDEAKARLDCISTIEETISAD